MLWDPKQKFYLTIIYAWSAASQHRILSPNYTLLFVACLGSLQMSRASQKESPNGYALMTQISRRKQHYVTCNTGAGNQKIQQFRENGGNYDVDVIET